jgi:hypothetical protein
MVPCTATCSLKSPLQDQFDRLLDEYDVIAVFYGWYKGDKTWATSN